MKMIREFLLPRWLWTEDYARRSRRWWANFGFHISLALDDFIQAWLPDGVIGITISSRTGTANDHGHTWGRYGEWALQCWPFGPDKETGDCHCTSAIKNDCWRAVDVLRSLLTDNTVVESRHLQAFKLEVLAKVKEILEVQ